MADPHQPLANRSATRPRRTRWVRRGVVGLVGALVLLGVASLVLPVLAGGPLLRWAAARATGSLCGSFQVGGGALGWNTVPQLVRGRPVHVSLRDVRITSPQGADVLIAAELSAAITLHRRPWRVTIADARVARGRWELASSGGATPGFIQAWSPIPTGATRALCTAPAQRRRHGVSGDTPPPRPPAADTATAVPGTPILAIVGLRLEAMDVALDFPVWGLRLNAVDARGTLSVGGSAFFFEAIDARAKTGGLLRVGAHNAGWTTRVPFDLVSIRRVAVAADAPADLSLDVEVATTGRSRLSGLAVFRNVFANRDGRRRTVGGRHFPRPPPAGLDLDARWQGVGDALARMEADWRGHWAPPPGQPTLDGDVTITLRGPFEAPAGELTVSLAGARLNARLASTGWLDTDVTVDDADTTALLNPALHPLLGGRLSGTLRLRALVAPTLGETVADVREANLRLDRRRRGPFPRRFELRIAQRATPPSGVAARDRARSDETLAVALAVVRLSHATLRLEGIDATWATLRARGAVTANAGNNQVEARFSVNVGSIARLLPELPIRGASRFELTLRGRAEHLAARIRFASPPLVIFWDETFTLPSTLTASLESGDILTIDRFTVGHAGGGAVSASGRLVFDGPLAAHVDVRDYPLADVPGLGRVPLPAFLSTDKRYGSLGDALRGTVAAALDLRGSLEQPTINGGVALRSVRLAGRPIGDGDMRLRARTDRVAFDGSLGNAVTFEGVARRQAARAGGALTGNTTIALRDFPLRPWLPSGWAALAPTLTGKLEGSLGPASPPTLRAALRLVGAAGDLDLQATVEDDRAAGRLRGRLELARLAPVWSRWLSSASGALDVDLTLPNSHTPVSALESLTGQVAIGREVVVRAAEWPSALTVAAGGRVDIDGRRLRSPGLVLSAWRGHARATVGGAVDIEPDTPATTRLDVTLGAHADAAALRPLPRAWRSIDGTVDVAGHVGGTLAAPHVEAEARINVALQLASPPTSPGLPAVHAVGRVKAHGDLLRTSDLRVAIARVGELTIGSAREPASVRVAGLAAAAGPLRLGEVAATITGRNLRLDEELLPISIADLDLALRLTGRFDGPLLLSGNVDVSHAKLDTQPKRAPARARTSRAHWYQAIPPRLTVDLTLRGQDGGLSVGVPYLPDVTADFDCRLIATSRGAAMGGRLGGAGLYSKAAITLYDWMQPNRIRRCQVLPP